MGEEMLMPYIRQCAHDLKSMGAALHRKAMDYLRLYMIIGGMPQAIQAYIDTQDFAEVDRVKRNILNLYRNDIYQYAGDDAPKVVQIFDSIPSQLQRREKRFRIGEVRKGARTRDFANAFFWLDESRVVNVCYAATEPSVGLKLHRDDSRYKLYFGDTGLLISHSFDEAEIQSDELYRKLMLGKLEINKGMFVENIVAQMFRANRKQLYYYSNVDNMDSKKNMEIDFLIRKPFVTSRHNICPVEVKSTKRYTTSSLDKFRKRYGNYLHSAYIFHSSDVKVTDEIIYLPLYMAAVL
jgi:predicted AAA+ superfamily ATPase